MFKNLFRVFLFILITIIIFISYLSIFGVQTSKFNELIKSQINKQNKKFDIKLDKVFIKLDINERSFYLNTQNVDFFISNHSQKFKNIDLFINISSFLNQESKIKKIVINSEQNNISKFLKFIRAYQTSIPILFLENSIREGNISYDFIINFNNNEEPRIEISGKIIDLDINILRKEKFNNINFNFKLKNKNLEIVNLKLKYKNLIFKSKKIVSNIKNDLINIKGDLSNNLDMNLISNLTDLNIKKYLNDKTLLPSNSDFEIVINKKLKLKDYKIKTTIKFNNLDLNIRDINLNSYISNLKNKIYLQGGEIKLNTDIQNNQKITLKTKYNLVGKGESKNLSLNYSKNNLHEKYDFFIDLMPVELNFEEIGFNKKANDDFFLNIKGTKKRDNYNIENLSLYNKKNKFILNNIKLQNNFKIEDFSKIVANYYNRDDFLNEILIEKQKNKIKLFSNKFDISSNIEKSLKSTNKSNFLNIFQNLNSLIIIDVKSAKLDNDHNLKDVRGKIHVKDNVIELAKIEANFNKEKFFSYTKDEIDGIKVITVYSDVAKPFVKKFNFIKGFENGKLDYTSREINENLHKSELRMYDFNLKDMPILTKLLSLASLQGIADLATGEGIRFNELDMFFDNTKDLITIDEIYALGPAISILMEGYVEKNKLVSLKGTLVPATTINKTIAKIPLLGSLLVGEKAGEGVFGVSFKIKGPPDKLDTRVNPIKTLTPRFITRTLDKIKKTK